MDEDLVGVVVLSHPQPEQMTSHAALQKTSQIWSEEGAALRTEQWPTGHVEVYAVRVGRRRTASCVSNSALRSQMQDLV